MARNRLNYLLHCKKVVEIVNQHYEEGWTTYAAVWRKYVNPVYPMSYATFIKIINMSGLDRQIEEAEAKAEASIIETLPLFENPSLDLPYMEHQRPTTYLGLNHL